MFYTIQKNVTQEIVEKKSKFIADLFYIENKTEAENRIKEIKKKYYDAKHHCFAYITFDEDKNIIERCSDDGEPAGTAGAPMLALLKGNKLCNVLVVVTRYFGGILLGTGGLVRAYSEATSKALNEVELMTIEQGKVIKVLVTYPEIENLKYYCRKNSINIIKEEYLDNVEIYIEISNEMLDKMKSDLDKKHLKMTKIDIIGEKYIKTNAVI